MNSSHSDDHPFPHGPRGSTALITPQGYDSNMVILHSDLNFYHLSNEHILMK